VNVDERSALTDSTLVYMRLRLGALTKVLGGIATMQELFVMSEPLTLLPKSLLDGRSKFVRGFQRSVVTDTGKRLKSNINEEFIEPV
jgi:hypothetical protein